MFGFVNIEVIQDDMQLLSRIPGDHLVEESQKVAPPSALRMPTPHLPSQHLQGGKQRDGPMALVQMAEARHRVAIGQLQVALGSLQGLDMRLLLDRQDDGILGRIEVQAHNVGRLGRKLGSVLIHQLPRRCR